MSKFSHKEAIKGTLQLMVVFALMFVMFLGVSCAVWLIALMPPWAGITTILLVAGGKLYYDIGSGATPYT